MSHGFDINDEDHTIRSMSQISKKWVPFNAFIGYFFHNDKVLIAICQFHQRFVQRMVMQ